MIEFLIQCLQQINAIGIRRARLFGSFCKAFLKSVCRRRDCRVRPTLSLDGMWLLCKKGDRGYVASVFRHSLSFEIVVEKSVPDVGVVRALLYSVLLLTEICFFGLGDECDRNLLFYTSKLVRALLSQWKKHSIPFSFTYSGSRCL